MGGHNSGRLFGNTSNCRQQMFHFKKTSNGNYRPVNSLNKDQLNDSKNVKFMLLNSSKTKQCKKIIEELYREGASVGDGGCADAIRKQLLTRELVGNKDHIKKGKERLRQINNILAKNYDHPDKSILEFLANDLKQSLGGN